MLGLKVIADKNMLKGTFALVHDGDVKEFCNTLNLIADLKQNQSVSHCPICWLVKKLRAGKGEENG